jgi:hypothetical protein
VEVPQQGDEAEHPAIPSLMQTGAIEEEDEKADDVVELLTSEDNEVIVLELELEISELLDELVALLVLDSVGLLLNSLEELDAVELLMDSLEELDASELLLASADEELEAEEDSLDDKELVDDTSEETELEEDALLLLVLAEIVDDDAVDSTAEVEEFPWIDEKDKLEVPELEDLLEETELPGADPLDIDDDLLDTELLERREVVEVLVVLPYPLQVNLEDEDAAGWTPPP